MLFSVNKAHRTDPYKNFKFRVYLEGNQDPVAGLSKMSALKKITEVIEWREAGASDSVIRKMPGRTKFEAITLEAGLSHDSLFQEWANQVNHPEGDAKVSERNYRKTVSVEVLNLAGQAVLRFNLKRAWVSEFQALPEMDGNANAVAITSIKIEHEGFALDASLKEPTER